MEAEVSNESDMGLYKNNEDGTYTVSGKLFDEGIDDYYFESDNLALKENPDYCKLLRAVAILESQRIKAIQDLDRLMECRQQALSDPVAFVEKLQRNEDLDLPRPQRIFELPDLDWDKYTTKLGSLTHKHMTRNKRPTGVSGPNVVPSSSVAVITDHSSASSSSFTESRPSNAAAELDDSSTPVVRGRVCSAGKPQTFNQLWTCEEQRRLERLLVEHPPEAVEARRWEKIANALGNRTPLQVASRVQKYFIKLTKAGLPVPGRIPNVSTYVKRSGFHKHQRHNRLLFSRSTFFASHEPPVYMSEYDDDGTMQSNNSSTDGDSNWTIDNEFDERNRELTTTEDFKDFVYQKNRRRNRQNDKLTSLKCYECHQNPIVGTHWRCIDCPKGTLVLCNNCYTCAVDTPTHRSHHRLEAIATDDDNIDAHLDEDYTTFRDGYYNYLDPNFIPDA